MRKFCFLLLFLTATLFNQDCDAAGRLNFMLVNLTDQDIVDARIFPTKNPNFISENLLKTPLDPNTRVYIGPNYYGEQKIWSIQLTWADGREQTFARNQLTRYNAYIAYNTPRGIKLRQTYEPSFARYDFSSGAPIYATGAPDISVAVSAPEKANVAPEAKRVALNDSPKKSGKRATRDLVFEEDEDSAAPLLQDSGAARIDGETIAMKATVELTRDGKTSSVLPSEDFKSGDKVRLVFSANRDGHIYWLAKGTSGQYQVLFPTKKAGMDNSIKRNKEYTVPAKGAWKFDDTPGAETIVAILAPEPLENLDRAVKLASEGDKKGASDIVAAAVGSHEKKRVTRDLVFEEEDDDEVNTKSQKSSGDDPFVAIYELNHN